MDRRAFLRACVALAAVGVADPERLLWTPKPIIVVPALPVSWDARPTLEAWAARIDPTGCSAAVAELLGLSDEVLTDVVWRDLHV